VVEVTVREGEPLEKALRRFKKKWERAGILRDVKRNLFTKNPVIPNGSPEKKLYAVWPVCDALHGIKPPLS
jgi:small subunit ribosomal protein S21